MTRETSANGIAPFCDAKTQLRRQRAASGSEAWSSHCPPRPGNSKHHYLQTQRHTTTSPVLLNHALAADKAKPQNAEGLIKNVGKIIATTGWLTLPQATSTNLFTSSSHSPSRRSCRSTQAPPSPSPELPCHSSWPSRTPLTRCARGSSIRSSRCSKRS